MKWGGDRGYNQGHFESMPRCHGPGCDRSIEVRLEAQHKPEPRPPHDGMSS